MRARFSIWVIAILFAAAPASARLSDFTGHWRNSNRENGRLIMLEIRIDQSRVMVSAYAHCDDRYCNWDAAEVLPYAAAPSSNLAEDATAIYVVFKRPDSDVTLILSLPGDAAQLRVEEFTRFTDNSGRTNFATASNFVKDVAGDGHTGPKDGHTVADGHTWPKDGQHAKPPDDTIPQFPWPPPLASATDVIARSFLPHTPNASLNDIDQRLSAALDVCGYVGKSYYAVPDGFALVTQLEQINPDGTSKPMPARWAAKVQPLSTFSLSDYLRALFTANPGRYRIIVFVVTSHPFSQTDAKVSKEDALGWVSKGLNQLPASIGNLRFTADYAATALIYEFDEPHAGENAVFITPSALTGRDHLTKSNLLPTLEK